MEGEYVGADWCFTVPLWVIVFCGVFIVTFVGYVWVVAEVSVEDAVALPVLASVEAVGELAVVAGVEDEVVLAVVAGAEDEVVLAVVAGVEWDVVILLAEVAVEDLVVFPGRDVVFIFGFLVEHFFFFFLPPLFLSS